MEAKLSLTRLIDDIECREWLQEIDMVHYEEVFLTNFSYGGKLLSRRRLRDLRLQDFPKMAITNYHDQKILLDHIRHTLSYAFHSPVRRSESKQKFEARTPVHLRPPAAPVFDEAQPKYIAKVTTKEEKKLSKKAERRKRRSFDNDVWDKINALRSKDISSNRAVEQMREGHVPDVIKMKEREKEQSLRARRYSFGEKTPIDQLTSKQKGKLYGNMALEYDIIQKEMAMIKAEHMLFFQSLINCEMGRLYFVSEVAREIIVMIGHEWYREKMDSDIAGICADTGKVMNIPDVYADGRFNKNLDIMTGLKTRNLLCMPVRANRGGGRVIGVVEMINKIGPPGAQFDLNDEQILVDCVQRIADDIHNRFQELTNAAEALTGTATFVAEGSRSRRNLTYQTATSSSASSAVRKTIIDHTDRLAGDWKPVSRA